MSLIFNSREQMERGLADRPSRILSDGTPLRDLIDFDRREVKMRVLNDPELHQLELQYIFARAWVVVGHVSEIPKPGDFMLRHIGQDAVIVTRTSAGEVSILLNACSHRGMEICWADRGNQSIFKCPYHGWAFNNEGSLLGAPYEKEMYPGWNKAELPLARAKVAIRHGVIFGSFDDAPPSLDDWLGEFGWYFDVMYGGAELEPLTRGGARQTIRANWKAAAEQNCGDGYHSMTLHHATVELGLLHPPPTDAKGWGNDCHDVSSVQGHGIRCVEHAHHVFHLVDEPEPFPVGWFLAGALFPGINAGGSISRRSGALFGPESDGNQEKRLYHSANLGAITPRGPNAYVQWSVSLVQQGTPEAMKQAMRKQFGGAVVGADDQEAWPSMTRVAQGFVGQRQPIRYNAILGASRREDWPGPALVHHGYSMDDNQWHFWLRWYDMLTDVEAA